MSDTNRFILQTMRRGTPTKATAFIDEAVAMQHTLVAARSGQFERVLLMRDAGIARHVIFDSAYTGNKVPDLMVERDESRLPKRRRSKAAKAAKTPPSPIELRRRAAELVTLALIVAVLLFAIDHAFNQ